MATTSATFELEVVTPEGRLFDGQVRSAVLPGSDGSFGVLARHAPLLAALDTGVMELTLPDGEVRHFAVGEGFVEVSLEGTKVLTDFADLSGDIDVARAQHAEAKAREVLKSKVEQFERARAMASLRRALMRLRVARR